MTDYHHHRRFESGGWDFSRIKAGGLRMTMETDKQVGAKVIELSDQNIQQDALGLQSGEPLS